MPLRVVGKTRNTAGQEGGSERQVEEQLLGFMVNIREETVRDARVTEEGVHDVNSPDPELIEVMKHAGCSLIGDHTFTLHFICSVYDSLYVDCRVKW
jgi:hypothetical protein